MGGPQHVVAFHDGIVEPLSVGHASVDYGLEGSTQGCVINFGAKPLNYASSGEAANPLRHGIGRQMHSVAKGLPSDSSVSLQNTENFSVYFVY
jgi:hypothetical protein